MIILFLENCKFKGTFRKYQAEVLKEFDKHIKDKKIKVNWKSKIYLEKVTSNYWLNAI